MYFDQLAKAAQAGDRPSAEEMENYARQLTQDKYGASDMDALSKQLHGDGGNAVASFLQGATANFADELVGLLPDALGGGEAGAEQLRLRNDMMRREHRVGDFVAQAAGGVGGALALPFGGAARGASLAQKIRAGAKVGAVFGGLNGAGSGETLEDRAVGGAVGAVGGGLVGAAVPRVAASRPVAAVSSAMQRLAGHAAELSPVEQGFAKLSGARAQVEKAIENLGGFGAAREANAALAAGGRGAEARLVDLGKPMTDLADFAATNSSKAHTVLSDIVEQRGESSTARVLDDFKAAAGDHHAPSRQAELAAETKAWADGPDAYGTRQNGLGLHGKNPMVPLKDAEPLVTQPRIKKLFADAKEIAEIGPDGEDVATRAMNEARKDNPELNAFMAKNPKLNVASLLEDADAIAQLEAMGKGPLIAALKAANGAAPFDVVQELHRSLADAASHAFSKRQNFLGFKLKDSAAIVQRTLEETIPGYADIVDKYAERKALETASKLGEEWFNKKADIVGLNKIVAKLADKPELLEEFRRGLASKQIIALQRTDGANAATKMMIGKNNLAQQNMNKIVFGNEATYDKFMQQAKAERQLGKLARATGGSQTAGRTAAREDALGVIGEELQRAGRPSVLRMGMNKARQLTVGPVLEKRADELLPFLTEQGDNKIAALLDLLERTSPRANVGIGSTHAAPGAITSLFGRARSQD